MPTKILPQDIGSGVDFTISEVSLSNGTAALPSLAFAGDQDTGLYLSGADELSISTNGGVRFRVETSAVRSMQNFIPDISGSLTLGTTSNAWARSLLSDGSVSAPAYTFAGDQNTGFYRTAAGNTRYAAQGVNTVSFINGGLEIASGVVFNTDGSATSPSFTFNSDQNTGFYRVASDRVGLSLGGTVRYTFADTSLQLTGTDHSYLILDRAANTNESLVLFSTASSTSAAVGLDNDGTERLAFFTNGDLGTPKVTIDSGGTTTFVEAIREKDGSAAAPSYTFTSDTDTGIFRSPNVLGFSVDAVEKFRVDTNRSRHTVAAHFIDGTAAIPSIAFDSDTDTGFYSPGAGGIAITNNATRRWTFDAAGALVGNTSSSVIFVADGAAGAPGYTFDADQDTGVYRRLADSVGVATGGSLRFDFNNAVVRSHVPMEIINTSSDATLLLDSQSTGRASQISFRNSTPITHRIGIETDTDAGGGAFLGNANSLNFEVSGSNRMYFSNQSTARFFLDGGTLQSNTPGQMEIGSPGNYWGRVLLADGSASVPSYTFGNDADTGIYRFSSNELSVALGGVERLRVSTSNGANDIRLLLWDHTANALVQVTRGAADSGGAGFRVLRVPN